MDTKKIGKQQVTFHRYHTIIVGAGAAGMNCAVHLYEFMSRKGVEAPQDRIAIVTRGLELGASRMSGSDKQTYYKQGTSPNVPDCAKGFADTLTAAGCCHADLALIEGITSLREFYHLVGAGVAFPTDSMGTFIGYKTDHDPAERATSAGPKTSKFMSECLQKQVQRYGIPIFDRQEAAQLLVVGAGKSKRIAGIVTAEAGPRSSGAAPGQWNVFLATNVVLAAGGPGELYRTSVYPAGQFGLHGLALKAGLAAENLTESQFGLASTKFRWNVSGTYMQAIPRIFSTDAQGRQEHNFLADFFPSMKTMATDIFLKGYQWPFDPQKIENLGSSLIDVLVFNETQKGRRVFLDFRQNPVGTRTMQPFNIDELAPEAFNYLQDAGALQETPIERLAHMNPPAIEIYKEHNIDLYHEPLEIAVCAQHNNGGLAVNKWWESSIPHTFVIGEMAGTHGVKRPGGSALNAGQVGGLRAAEYIVNVYGKDAAHSAQDNEAIDRQIQDLLGKLERWSRASGRTPEEVVEEIRMRMTASAAHIREEEDARKSLGQAIELCKHIRDKGLPAQDPQAIHAALRAEHLALASVAYLKAIVDLLEQDGGSRGSYLVLSSHGIPIHPDIRNPATGEPLAFKPENVKLRDNIQQTQYDESEPDLFRCTFITPRTAPLGRKSFEPAWREYREGGIYREL
ncbi:MAG: FAD-binding protein [Planctomycetes bacterium]|jgi:succinate dehydrogenase/fumarate reductase flavoprotein subunit|nr:FAD-binding protein [Planctomycetota bacterium]